MSSNRWILFKKKFHVFSVVKQKIMQTRFLINFAVPFLVNYLVFTLGRQSSFKVHQKWLLKKILFLAYRIYIYYQKFQMILDVILYTNSTKCFRFTFGSQFCSIQSTRNPLEIICKVIRCQHTGLIVSEAERTKLLDDIVTSLVDSKKRISSVKFKFCYKYLLYLIPC